MQTISTVMWMSQEGQPSYDNPAGLSESAAAGLRRTSASVCQIGRLLQQEQKLFLRVSWPATRCLPATLRAGAPRELAGTSFWAAVRMMADCCWSVSVLWGCSNHDAGVAGSASDPCGSGLTTAAGALCQFEVRRLSLSN